MTYRRVVGARLERMKRDLLALVTLRRRESAFGPYAMRLFALAMLLLVLPIKAFVQLGIVGGLLATLKFGLVAALVAGALAVAFAIGEATRRRARWSARRRALRSGAGARPSAA